MIGRKKNDEHFKILWKRTLIIGIRCVCDFWCVRQGGYACVLFINICCIWGSTGNHRHHVYKWGSRMNIYALTVPLIKTKMSSIYQEKRWCWWKLSKLKNKCFVLQHHPGLSEPGGSGDHPLPPHTHNFWQIQTRGGDYVPHITSCYPGFSDLPTALTPPLLVRVIYDTFQCQMALISTMNLNIELCHYLSNAADWLFLAM